MWPLLKPVCIIAIISYHLEYNNFFLPVAMVLCLGQVICHYDMWRHLDVLSNCCTDSRPTFLGGGAFFLSLGYRNWTLNLQGWKRCYRPIAVLIDMTTGGCYYAIPESEGCWLGWYSQPLGAHTHARTHTPTQPRLHQNDCIFWMDVYPILCRRWI